MKYDLVLYEKEKLQKITTITNSSLPRIGESIHHLGVGRQFKVDDIIYHTTRCITSNPSCEISHIEVIVKNLINKEINPKYSTNPLL